MLSKGIQVQPKWALPSAACPSTVYNYFLFQCSDKSCLRTPSMKRRPTDSSAEGKKDTGMLKYIRNQVSPYYPLLECKLLLLLQIHKDGVLVVLGVLSSIPLGNESVSSPFVLAYKSSPYPDWGHVWRHFACSMGAPDECGWTYGCSCRSV